MEFQAVCRACGTRMSWHGTMDDRPPCPNPKCGFKPSKTVDVDRRIERQYQHQATPALPGFAEAARSQ